jgi:hypothetical protein
MLANLTMQLIQATDVCCSAGSARMSWPLLRWHSA